MTDEYTTGISEFIKKKKVVDLESIQGLFPERSRISIIRDLVKLHYITSYNYAGGYYTLPQLTNFNEDGLWFYGNARFSVHGSLKNTVKNMIDQSPAGKTNDELKHKLGVRVQNTLLDLSTSLLVMRKKYQGIYVYFNKDDQIYNLQMKKRNDAASMQENPYITIEVLRAVITHPDLPAAGIHKVLVQDGLTISPEQVEAVFQTYNLGKKNSL
jgi:hypothetical protein